MYTGIEWKYITLDITMREKRIKRKEIKWNNVSKEAKTEGLTRKVEKWREVKG